MKKLMGILALLLLTTFVLAVEEPTIATDSDVEKIEGAIEIIPIDENTGKIDPDKLNPFKTKADERIEKINLWLKGNASWLKVVFGMVPSVTWLFIINFYLLLWFIVLLILNGNATFGWMPMTFFSKKINLILFEWTGANIFGLLIFLLVHVSGIIQVAAISIELFFTVLNQTFFFKLLTTIIAIILLVAISRVLKKVQAKFEERKKAKAQAEQELNQEILGKIIHPITSV
jgi:hypothetical protein